MEQDGMTSDAIRREGFWRSAQEPDLPMPTPDVEWADRDDFLARLSRMEATARVVRYRGWSACRICGCGNGSATFSLGGWEWPSGFAHYVRDHGVVPSAAFIAFAAERTADPAPTVQPAAVAAAADSAARLAARYGRTDAPAIPKTDADVMAALRADTPLNRARAAFSAAAARIEQAGQQRRPAGPIEIRRMEFEAVAAIAAALGVGIPEA